MRIETSVSDANGFLQLVEHSTTLPDVVANAQSCIRCNIEEFQTIYKECNGLDPYRHVVIFAADSDRGGTIVAYRYFLMSPGDPWCRMFATFVSQDYRKKGIAKRMILQSFEMAIADGFSKIEIRMSPPQSEEKDGLYRWYSSYADANSQRFQIKIWYTGKIHRLFQAT